MSQRVAPSPLESLDLVSMHAWVIRERILAQMAIAVVADPEGNPFLDGRLEGLDSNTSPRSVLTAEEQLAIAKVANVIDTMIRGFGGSV